MSYRTEGGISIRLWWARALKEETRPGRVAGDLKQEGWDVGRLSKGLGGWGLEEAEGLGAFRRLDVRTF